MSERVHCCVPFCRRTTSAARIAPHTEWICADHWRMVPRRLKLFKNRVSDAYATAKVACDAISNEGDEFAKVHGGGIHVDILARFRVAADLVEKRAKQLNRVWEWCKRAAIEAAGGIG